MSDQRVCLDLFAGLGGFSSAFEGADDREVVTVEWESEFDPDICADIRDLGPDDFPDPDVVLASPPCQRFSVACINSIWDHDEERRPRHLTEKADVAQAIETVFHTLWLVQELQPRYWFMENPQGMLRTFIGEPVGQVHYCQYGEDFKEPTDLWGRHPPMHYRRCPGKSRCHHVSNPREVNTFRDESRTRAVDSSNSAERAKVPYKLSDQLRTAVEDAFENPPPEQATLVPDGGERNPLSVSTVIEWLIHMLQHEQILSSTLNKPSVFNEPFLVNIFQFDDNGAYVRYLYEPIQEKSINQSSAEIGSASVGRSSLSFSSLDSDSLFALIYFLRNAIVASKSFASSL